MLERLRSPWSDRRAELTLGAVSLLVGVVVIAMIAFVVAQAWPTFSHEGLSWLGSGGDLKSQLETMQNAGPHPAASAFYMRAWPLIWGTIITTVPAVLLGLGIAVLSSIFIVELAPARLRRIAIPVIRLLASVPSVVYGLIGILVLVPFVLNHIISPGEKASLANTVLLDGAGVGVAIVILTVMITPIMVALICEALISVPNAWTEGAIALGCNPVRAMLAVTVRAARPAIVAAAVLASARALGEAVMISMVGGAVNFAPAPQRRVHVPLRADAHACRRRRRLPRRHRRAGAEVLALRLGGAAALLRLRALRRGVSDQAAAAEVPGARMSAVGSYDPRTRPPMGDPRGRRSSPREWRWSDRLALVFAWGAGLALCLIAAAIVIYMGYRGVQYLRPQLLIEHPVEATLSQAHSGGFLDPIEGTLLLTAIGILLTLPLAVSAALWITEYGRPSWLARVVESSIEVVAGTPDIVIAVFGVAFFQLSFMAPFSFRAAGGGVYGRSFIAAGALMSLIALPPVFTATRDGLQTIPSHMREAAYALGKTRIATIRSVLLPSVRTNIAAGVTLGVSRIIGDTAIIIVVLGGLKIEPQGGTPVLGLLKGTGGTLTSYVYENSPAGEGAAPQKAYVAAFVLMLMVLGLNLLVDRIGRAQRRRDRADLAYGVV